MNTNSIPKDVVVDLDITDIIPKEPAVATRNTEKGTLSGSPCPVLALHKL